MALTDGERVARRKAKLVAAGLCISCGQNKPVEGKKNCEGCRKRKRKLEKIYKSRMAKLRGVSVDKILRSLEPTETPTRVYNTKSGICGGGHRVMREYGDN